MLLPAFATTLRLQKAEQVRLGPLVVYNSVCVCACGRALLHQTITALQAGQAALYMVLTSCEVVMCHTVLTTIPWMRITASVMYSQASLIQGSKFKYWKAYHQV